MIVDYKLLKLWKLLKKQGTITDIHRQSGVSRVTLNKAFNHGIASAETIDLINNYLKSQGYELQGIKSKESLFL